jgi:hypothetical protein
MLDEYVEDELNERQAAQASAHINVCAECADHYEELKRERQIYFRYFTSLEATPALSVGVRAAIAETERKRASDNQGLRERLLAAFGISSFNPAHGAVALALLITLGVVISVMKFQSAGNRSQPEPVSQKGDAPEPPILIAEGRGDDQRKQDAPRSIPVKRAPQNTFSAGPTLKPTAVEAVEKARRQYLKALATLSRDIERRPRLSPEVLSQFEKSLADVDRTISATQQAVRQQPGDVAAVQYMTAAYAKKIELLRDIAGR